MRDGGVFATMDPHSPGLSSDDPGSKVAIPRLKQRPLPSFQPKKHAREPHIMTACNMCRKRRVRCSGHQPSCIYCQKNNIDCVYGHPRRDRLKVALEWNRSFAAILKDLRSCVNREAAMRIDRLLAKSEDDLFHTASHPSVRPNSQIVYQLGSEPSDIPSIELPHKRSSSHRETLESLEIRQSLSRRFSDVGHNGRNVETQRLHNAQGQMQEEDVDSLDRRYSDSGTSQATVDESSRALDGHRQLTGEQLLGGLTDTSYYLYNNDIRIDYDDPGSGTVDPMYDYYFNATPNTLPPIATEFSFNYADACTQQDTVDHLKFL